MKIDRQFLTLIIFIIFIAFCISFPTAFLQTNQDGSYELRITSDPDEIANNSLQNIQNLKRFQQRFAR
jgi:hypothetical protein